jgi:hypothetical protein
MVARDQRPGYTGHYMASKKKNWIITAQQTHKAADVAGNLRKAGLSRVTVNEEIGSITGEASEEALEKLRKVPGVADVSPDTNIDIGPPGSEKTW